MFSKRRFIPVNHRVLFQASLFSVFLLLSLFCLSCQTESGEDGWSADGVISAGEYTDNASYINGAYSLSWTSDEEYIYIGIEAKTNGFVAIGFGNSMLQTDVVFGYVKDGETYIYDVYINSYLGPHPEDTDLGGTDDILDYGASEEGDYTIIEFKRKLDTGDNFDSAIIKGESNNILWAFGGTDGMMSIHSQRGYDSIEP